MPHLTDYSFGELLVSEQDSIRIDLKKEPKRILVRFKDEQKIIPCNPQDFDLLEYEVVKGHVPRKNNKYALIIKWNVSDVREVEWAVYY